MRCDACGSEHLRVEVIFPPVSSLDLKLEEGLLKHVRTGRTYRIWRLCDACRRAIKERGSVLSIPFSVGGGKRKRRAATPSQAQRTRTSQRRKARGR